MAQALGSGLPAEAHATDISISIRKTPRATYSKIREGLAPLDQATLLAGVRPSTQWLSQLKFSSCLPENIATRVFVERLDVSPWDEFIKFSS